MEHISSSIFLYIPCGLDVCLKLYLFKFFLDQMIVHTCNSMPKKKKKMVLQDFIANIKFLRVWLEGSKMYNLLIQNVCTVCITSLLSYCQVWKKICSSFLRPKTESNQPFTVIFLIISWSLCNDFKIFFFHL